MASRQGFEELKTEQLGGHSQEQQRHRQAQIDECYNADYVVTTHKMSVRLFITRWYSIKTAKHIRLFTISQLIVFIVTELGMLIPGYLDTRVLCGLPGSRETNNLPSYRDRLHQSTDCPCGHIQTELLAAADSAEQPVC